jgi:DNA-binding CsgD family transcriptional regulator
MRTQQAHILAHIIQAIGERDFAAVAADSILGFMKFELSSVVVYPRRSRPFLMFDNFDAAGGREGLDNYVAVTHKVNPMLAHASHGIGTFRARDFANRAQAIDDASPYLVPSPSEELGFRTVGWPERLEEVGLYFNTCGGLVELSVYRERGHHAAAADKIEALEALRAPIAAAFDKHAMLARRIPADEVPFTSILSPREAEITQLLLLGCGSEAIALRLAISRHTVKDHRKQIFRKLGISSIAELFALQRRVSR